MGGVEPVLGGESRRNKDMQPVSSFSFVEDGSLTAVTRGARGMCARADQETDLAHETLHHVFCLLLRVIVGVAHAEASRKVVVVSVGGAGRELDGRRAGREE